MGATSAAAVLDWWFGGASHDDDASILPERHPTHDARPALRTLSAADSTLVAAIRNGDERTFDTLFREHFARLANFAAATTGDPAIGEELAADVFLSLWRRREAWDPRHGVTPYLYRAVRNLARNYIRDRSAADLRERAAAVELAGIAGDVTLDTIEERTARLAAVWRAVDQLPEARRAVVHLRWRAGMSFEEIAALLDTSPAAVKMQISRALATVRALLPTAFE